MKKECAVSVGGQAVLEGVMMRSGGSIATAVRNPEGKIVLETQRVKSAKDGSKWRRLPIIRGIDSFISSLVVGMKAISRTGEVYAASEQTSKFERWLSKKLRIDIMDIAVFIGIVLGLGLAILLFVLAPQFITDGILKLAKQQEINSILKNLIAGVIRILIFLGYILAVSLIKDIKRLFAYHGAEHKVINCYENGEELTPENASKYSTIHDRCGTAFLFLVLVVSILFFSFFGWPNIWIRVGTRILLLPIVAGLSYEVLKWAAKYDNIFVRIVKAPGKWLQKITTKEPDLEMLEVAICAFNEVMAMEADPQRATKSFDNIALQDALNKLTALVPKNEAELILMSVLGYSKRSELAKADTISAKKLEKAKEYGTRRTSGEPLQYILGSVNFYRYEIKVTPDVLIPRPETEILAEQAIEYLKTAIKEQDSLNVLELFTGSGAVAIAVKKQMDEYIATLGNEYSINVDAGDISLAALEVAGANAAVNNASILFYGGDMFAPFEGKKYNVIIANPPYISKEEIQLLDTEVKDYEPHLALDGGEDGLDFYRTIASQSAKYLLAGGCIFLEVGYTQGTQVAALFSSNYDVEIINDFNGVARIVKARIRN